MATTQEEYKAFSPAIRRARLDNLTIYEISEGELQTIERGSPDSICLTFSVSLLSVAISLLGSIMLTDIKSPVVLFSFIAIVVVGFVVGIILLIIWKKSSNSVAECVASIKRRLPPEGVPATPIAEA